MPREIAFILHIPPTPAPTPPHLCHLIRHFTAQIPTTELILPTACESLFLSSPHANTIHRAYAKILICIQEWLPEECAEKKKLWNTFVEYCPKVLKPVLNLKEREGWWARLDVGAPCEGARGGLTILPVVAAARLWVFGR